MNATYLDTLRALAAPRRAGPLVLVTGALLAAQAWYTRAPLHIALGLGAVVGFLALSPYLWRRWGGGGGRAKRSTGAGVAIAIASMLPGFIGFFVIPRVDGLATDFLGAGLNGVVVGALFLVGGWGLARDIDQEEAIARETARSAELARLAEHAELLALKANLDPHFLFNTLNAIAAWCAEDPAVAEAALLKLATVLRDVYAGISAPTWPLARELALARDVCALHAVRDPERYAAIWDDEGEEAIAGVPVPPLLLLPVIENAYKHGPSAGHSGPVRVRFEVDGGFVDVVVANPGPFLGPRPGGQGLDLVTRRAALVGGSFAIHGVPGGTEARVRLVR